MVDSIEFNLEGINQLQAKLLAIGNVAKKKGARAAGRKAAGIIQRAARANAKQFDDPTSPQAIWRNVAVEFNNRYYKKTGDIAFRIGLKGGAKYRKLNPGKKGPGGDTWYWRLLEFGTKNSVAKPFLRPALADNIDAVTTMFTTELNTRIEAALAAGRAD